MGLRCLDFCVLLCTNNEIVFVHWAYCTKFVDLECSVVSLSSRKLGIQLTQYEVRWLQQWRYLNIIYLNIILYLDALKQINVWAVMLFPRSIILFSFVTYSLTHWSTRAQLTSNQWLRRWTMYQSHVLISTSCAGQEWDSALVSLAARAPHLSRATMRECLFRECQKMAQLAKQVFVLEIKFFL